MKKKTVKKQVVKLTEKELTKVVGGRGILKANWRYTNRRKMTWKDFFK
ncbi:hypothetical protein [Lactobacillus sp. PSON]